MLIEWVSILPWGYPQNKSRNPWFLRQNPRKHGIKSNWGANPVMTSYGCCSISRGNASTTGHDLRPKKRTKKGRSYRGPPMFRKPQEMHPGVPSLRWGNFGTKGPWCFFTAQFSLPRSSHRFKMHRPVETRLNSVDINHGIHVQKPASSRTASSHDSEIFPVESTSWCPKRDVCWLTIKNHRN